MPVIHLVATPSPTGDSVDNFWSGKSVAVTGGFGFVGSHLVELLLSRGASVYVADNASRGTTRNEEAANMTLDVCNLNTCKYAFRKGEASSHAAPVDVVFNLAASVAGVIYNQSHNTQMFHDNVLLQTVPVIAAEQTGVPLFVQVSSVCVYAPDKNHPCKEENGLVGEPHPANGGYAWAKRAGERVAILSNIPKVVVVRPSNIFGMRDYFDEKAHVIPALIEKALTVKELVLYGDPYNVREFIYVDDVVRGMMAAAEHGVNREVYNLGCNGGNSITILRLAEQILAITGEDKRIITPDAGTSLGGDQERWSDSTKANRDLDWHYEITLENGLQKVIKWRNQYGSDARYNG